MYTLTERRIEKAMPILEKHRKQLLETGRFDHRLEGELRACWDTGYRELKDIFRQLIKIPRYQLLAAAYIEDGNFTTRTGCPMEFFDPLADLYKINRYDSKELDVAKPKFWQSKLRARGSAQSPAAPKGRSSKTPKR